MGFIYKITNKVNDKVYIGQTKRTIKIRWKEHLKKASIPSSQKLPLYKAMNRYGKENFSIEKIEECEDSQLDEREIYWISFYDSYYNGYNGTEGGIGGVKRHYEHLEEIAQRYQNGERLDKLCKEFHYDYTSFRPQFEAFGVKIDTHAGPKKNAKKVAAIDPKTSQVVAIYSSISDAARAICPPDKQYRPIGNHISRYKDTSTVSHGFYWKTKETLPNIDELEDKIIYDF